MNVYIRLRQNIRSECKKIKKIKYCLRKKMEGNKEGNRETGKQQFWKLEGNKETGKQHFRFSKGNSYCWKLGNRETVSLFPSCCFFPKPPKNGSRTSIFGKFVVFSQCSRKIENLRKQNRARSRANLIAYYWYCLNKFE